MHHAPVLAAFTVLALALTNVACAHAVRIESAPGAEIFVNGRSVGTAPATYHETTGLEDNVSITARLHGRESTVQLRRSDVDMVPVGVGTAVGAGGCMAGLAVSVVLALIAPPCAMVTGAASWGLLGSGPLAGWVWFGHKLPDVVRVELEGAAPAVAVKEDQPY